MMQEAKAGDDKAKSEMAENLITSGQEKILEALGIDGKWGMTYMGRALMDYK